MLTRTCCEKALNPKSEILRTPYESRRRFSGCKTGICIIICELGSRTQVPKSKTFKHTHQSGNQGEGLNLQISMVDASTVAIINSINKLMEIASSFILFEPPTLGLQVSKI